MNIPQINTWHILNLNYAICHNYISIKQDQKRTSTLSPTRSLNQLINSDKGINKVDGSDDHLHVLKADITYGYKTIGSGLLIETAELED